ncbi:hypothetical protein F4777DRAFT_581563 [Nemania sp. FL0916]|nr:hypothetical protein F4777DRAFT_581563 [Nemania sp. FL0916]
MSSMANSHAARGDLIDTEFIYQKSFSIEPNNISDSAWQNIFPVGRGFISHPKIAPNPMGLSVYHQLHCLDGIRRGYWAARNGTHHGSHDIRPSHIRHCIDYLRQSLMCHADMNLEPVNLNLGGVTGFNSRRKCYDIDKVKEWAQEWKAEAVNPNSIK